MNTPDGFWFCIVIANIWFAKDGVKSASGWVHWGLSIWFLVSENI